MSPRHRAAELAARRLVAKGHLTPRSLNFVPVPRTVVRDRAVFVRTSLAAVEAAHDVCVGPPPALPAPGVVRDPAS